MEVFVMVKAKGEVYKCSVCGNMVETLHVGGGTLLCCEKPMVLQVENTVEASTEKHIPVIEKKADGILVKVGAVAHPMEEKHYIEWIELTADGVLYRKYLNPGDAPEALFAVNAEAVSARAYCNLHGLWKS
jgi:superoxide reductase